MKKLLLIIGSLLVLSLLSAVGIYLVRSSGTPAQTPAGSVSLPSAGSAQNNAGGFASGEPAGFTIPAADGSPISALDFLHNGETIPDPVNSGVYILAGSTGYCLPDGTCPHGALTENFTITYSDKTHSFTITLLKEPVGASRSEAEQFMRSRLGVVEERLCTLDYYVGVPSYVNSVFSGKNLGFSFCKDTTKLPQ